MKMTINGFGVTLQKIQLQLSWYKHHKHSSTSLPGNRKEKYEIKKWQWNLLEC